MMKKFIVKSISGEYATLIDEKGKELFIAMMLLPLGCDIGDSLSYDGVNFDILPQK